MQTVSRIHVERPELETFGEVLVDSLRKTPWFAASLFLHALLFFILANVEFRAASAVEQATIAQVVPQLLEDPIAEIPDEIPVEEDIIPEEVTPELAEEPVPVEDPVDVESESPSDDSADDAFAEAGPALIGFGAGPGLFGDRRRTGHDGDGTGRREAYAAVEAGLEWLARHQSDDGRWDCDGFLYECDAEPLADGPGFAAYDVGVTGLSLLAFLGAGYTHDHGRYKDCVKNGLRWLVRQQDPEGCFAQRTSHNFTYDHAIATLALVEAYGLTEYPLFKRPAQRGVDFIHACKNRGRAWRYGVRPGDDDTSVTGWMVMALKSAVEAGLDVRRADLLDAVDFIDSLTGPEGRVAYSVHEIGPMRPAGKAADYPARYSESLTAVGILCRVFGGEDPAEIEDLQLGARLCSRQVPEWDRPKLDFYYWYYGTLALYQVGGDPWKRWNRAMIDALLPSQRKEPECLRGSWDPIDAWGEEGGRVYATALLTMCLEVYYRYPRVFGR